MSREQDYLEAIGWSESPDSLLDAMRDLTLRHAEQLEELGPVRVLALDPCPRCGGTVIASDTEARCVSGCKWSYRRHGAPEPLASRRADA